MEHLKYCLYARKSTESDEQQAMSIGAQVREMTELAQRENLELVDILQESKSAKATGKRVAFKELLEGINKGKYNAILTWSADRLSRNAGDLGKLVDLMDNGRLKCIRTFGQTFDNTPNKKFLLMILGSQAKLENDNRAKHIKRGIYALVERGIRPGPVPIGYKLERDPKNPTGRGIITIDEIRAPHIKQLFIDVGNSGMSGKKAADKAKEAGLSSINGNPVMYSKIYKILHEPFYYGWFEYPVGSGNLHRGIHEPIITPMLYGLVQKQLKKNLSSDKKRKWGSKNFFWSKLFKCGNCGSGICGTHHNNRHGKLYTYYKCTKYGGRNKCKEKYIREEKLVEQVSQLICMQMGEDVDLESKLHEKLQSVNQLQKLTNPEALELSMTQFIGHILRNGNVTDKREVLDSLQGNLLLESGEVRFEPKIQVLEV